METPTETPLNSLVAVNSRKVSLSEFVYEEIKLAIINKKIPPQYRLTETEVAKQMNVSTTPVREAFRLLSVVGLVKIVPWKGVIVQSYSEKEIQETYQCRIALEVLAVQL